MSLSELIAADVPDPDSTILTIHASREVGETLLHRFEVEVNAYEDAGTLTRVWHYTFPIMRETASSYQIDHYGNKKWVLKGSGKRYAYPNEDDAIFSLRKRTRWRQTHAHWALTKAHIAIDAFNRHFGDHAQFKDLKPLEKQSLST